MGIGRAHWPGSAMWTLSSASRALSAAVLLSWPRIVKHSATWRRCATWGSSPPLYLVDHRNMLRSQATELTLRHGGDILAGYVDGSPGDETIRWQVAKGSVGGRALAAARFTHEPVCFAGTDGERCATEYLPGYAANDIGQLEVLDDERVRPRPSRGWTLGVVLRCLSCFVHPVDSVCDQIDGDDQCCNGERRKDGRPPLFRLDQHVGQVDVDPPVRSWSRPQPLCPERRASPL